MTDSTWNQNGGLVVAAPTLAVSNTVWTQGGTLTVSNLVTTGGSWDMNTNLVVRTLTATNTTWTQNYALSLSALTLRDLTWTANGALTVTDVFDMHNVVLVGHVVPTLPSDDLVVDGWTYQANNPQSWDRIEVLNGGVIRHDTGSTGLWLTANTFVIDSNSTVDVSERGNAHTVFSRDRV